ncbi:extracellular solute-binding protein [Limnohabitans sp.]|jgi:putrescine transport system substrate-binding protein|uniref:extracellular solute-binding protein n=1 Tax=Limnohabitans sp. TaxID=1907725 RepID=UPI0037C187F8
MTSSSRFNFFRLFSPWTRRLSGWSLCLGLGCALSMPAQAQGELNMYNWSDYIGEKTVPNFIKEFGVKMRYDNFDSNEVVHAKLVAGRTGYDIVVPSSNWGALQARGGLLTKIDKSKIPNYKNLDPNVMAQLAKLDPGNQYLVPWFWGYTTVSINVDKVKRALGDLPMPDDAWALVFDPKYASRLRSCGVSFLDSGQDIMEAMFVYLGIPVDTTKATDFQRAWSELQKIRSSVTLFSSSGYINDLASGSLCVALGWSSDMNIARARAQEAKKGNDIQVLVPKKGAVLFYDTMVIPKDAVNVENAYKFINYRLQPEVAAGDSNQVQYPSAVAGAERFIKPEIANNKTIYLSPEDMANMHAPRMYNNDQRRLVTRSYTSFKTGI